MQKNMIDLGLVLYEFCMNFVCASEREYCFLKVVEGVAEVGEVEDGDREFLSQCATRRRSSATLGSLAPKSRP